MGLIRQRVRALLSAANLEGIQTGRIRGHQAEVRVLDEVRALFNVSREGRHTAYGLVYTRATRPLIDRSAVLMVRRSEGMSMKLAAEVLRYHWLTGER